MIFRNLLPRLFVFLCLVSFLPLSARENRFYVYNAANGLADNSAQTLLCTRSGRLVITTIGQINFFDGNSFSYIDPVSENIYQLSNYSGYYHLYFDRYHHLWLKDTHSVTCVDLVRERFVDSISEVFKEFGIEEQVNDLFVDQKNEIWILTEKGLFNVNKKQYFQIRQDRNLQDLEVYLDKYLLLFYDNGLVDVLEQNTGSKVFESRAYDQSMESDYDKTSVLAVVGNTFYQIRTGDTNSILSCFDIGKWEWKTVMKTPYRLNNVIVHDSLLYIPCKYGYWTYNYRTEETHHVEKLTLAQGGELETDINAMVFDIQGGLWAGTTNRGLLYSRPSASPFKNFRNNQPRAIELIEMMDKMPKPISTYRGKSVNCVFRDSRGWDWVGTASGLRLYKGDSVQSPIVYTLEDGLLNNVVHTIIEDYAHNIWVGTSFGVSCLLFKKDQFRYINSYNQWDAIPNGSFLDGRAIALSDGTIAMQMLDNVLEFNPSKMTTIADDITFRFSPKLVKLLVNGTEIKTGQEYDGNVILDKALSRIREINLNYNQNSVSLSFSALNYFRPQQTFYRVKVSGIDNKWKLFTRYNSDNLVDRQGKLHLPLMSLRPGSYEIQVQASMIPDKWETEPAVWVVNINEPWWRTTGILFLFGLLILALIAINGYYYMQNVSMRATRKSEELAVLKRIRVFAERCNQQGSNLLEPVPEDFGEKENFTQNMLTPEFIGMIQKIMPIVLTKDVQHLTMHELSQNAGMEIQPFYQLILGNIYKSPRPLAKTLMLTKAAELLMTTKKSVGEIAVECNFVSPNYFIATFYREYQMTPDDYRRRGSLQNVGVS